MDNILVFKKLVTNRRSSFSQNVALSCHRVVFRYASVHICVGIASTADTVNSYHMQLELQSRVFSTMNLM